MNPAEELQRRIRRTIPLSETMGWRIAALGDTDIRTEAPLAPNVNIHGTGFAGSLYALGILTAWGLCTQLIERAGLAAELVVAGANVDYRAPLRTDIVCDSRLDPALAREFLKRLAKQGHARLSLEVTIGDGPAVVIVAEMHARLT